MLYKAKRKNYILHIQQFSSLALVDQTNLSQPLRMLYCRGKTQPVFLILASQCLAHSSPSLTICWVKMKLKSLGFNSNPPAHSIQCLIGLWDLSLYSWWPLPVFVVAPPRTLLSWPLKHQRASCCSGDHSSPLSTPPPPLDMTSKPCFYCILSCQ